MGANFANIKNGGVNLDPLSTDPSNPKEGDLFVSDGTPRVAGLHRYDGSNWIEIGNPTTTSGDIAYSDGSKLVRLAKGSDDEVLTLASGLPSWAAPAVALDASVSKTTTYTATTSDVIIYVSTSGGNWTLTLYAASGNAGRRLKIIKTTSDTNTLTVDGNASETINGSTTTTVNTQYEVLELVCDGSNWFIDNRKANTAPVSYTPTVVGYGAGSGTPTGSWSRHGRYALISVKVVKDGTPGTSSSYIGFTLPSGLVRDTSYELGPSSAYLSNGTFYGEGQVLVDPTDGLLARKHNSGNNVDGPDLTAGAVFNIEAFVPITGWKGDNE